MMAANAEDGAPDGTVSAGYRSYALGLLMVILTLNFVDRHVMNILAERIKHDLHLSDGQLGILTGLGFALLYSVFGVPIARLAERHNRALILSACLAIWSAFTALGGLATSYAMLVVSRVGVGVGEAGCNPSAQSLITDYVPKARRASALAFYYIGAPLGVLVGMTVGGLIADWRHALLIVGLPGVALAAVSALTLKEPRRQAPPVAEHPDFRQGLAELGGKRTFWFAAVGAAMITFVSVGHTAFVPSFFLRNHGPELAALAAAQGLKANALLGPALGVIQGLSGILGVFVGGVIGDKLAARDPRAYVLLPAAAALIVAPLYTWAMLEPSAVRALGLLALPSFFHNLYFGPMFALIMSIVQPRTRATAAAVYGIFTSLIGLGLGPFGLGLMSDTFNHVLGMGEAGGLRWAMIWSNAVILVAVTLFWFASKTVRKDMVS
jgi:MFS family permease